MNRREFLRDATRALIVLPFGTFLVSCADGEDDGDVTVTTPTEPAGPPPDAPPRVEGGNVIYTSSQTNLHSHSFGVPVTDFTSTPPAGGRIGNTTEAQLHSHVLAVTQSDLERAAGGELVLVETTSVLAHSHTFTIVRV